MSGDTMNVTSAVLPGNVPRAIAIAHSVPSTSEIDGGEERDLERQPHGRARARASCSMRWYQRSDSAGGGRLKTEEALTDTASVTTSGASSVSTTRAVTVHITTVAARSIPITRDWTRSRSGCQRRVEQRARDDDGHRDQRAAPRTPSTPASGRA